MFRPIRESPSDSVYSGHALAPTSSLNAMNCFSTSILALSADSTFSEASLILSSKTVIRPVRPAISRLDVAPRNHQQKKPKANINGNIILRGAHERLPLLLPCSRIEHVHRRHLSNLKRQVIAILSFMSSNRISMGRSTKSSRHGLMRPGDKFSWKRSTAAARRLAQARSPVQHGGIDRNRHDDDEPTRSRFFLARL
jgi:hypothetical protein